MKFFQHTNHGSTCKVPIAQSSKAKHEKTLGHIKRIEINDADDRTIMLRKDILELENTLQRWTIVNGKGKEGMITSLNECIDPLDYIELLFK